MSLPSIVIIGCYFGRFAGYLDLWLRSCAMNPTVCWRVYTDQDPGPPPPNVTFVRTTLEDIRARASAKLGFEAALEEPYKLCDFKSLYGLIFEEDIAGYEFWGHCDFDMIFGDVRRFITPAVLGRYDKIFRLGHLTLFRNTRDVNLRFKLPGGTTGYRQVFGSGGNFCFDEIMVNEIYDRNGFPVYDERIFLDISMITKRFRAISLPNAARQLFFWENGRVFRAISEEGRVSLEEYSYIHFKKRGFDRHDLDLGRAAAFYIGPGGFRAKTPGEIGPRDFDEVNPYPGATVERLEQLAYRWTLLREGLKRRLMNLRPVSS